MPLTEDLLAISCAGIKDLEIATAIAEEWCLATSNSLVV